MPAHPYVISPAPCRCMDLQPSHASYYTFDCQFVTAHVFAPAAELSPGTHTHKQPIGSPKVNMALATSLYPLQPLLSPTIYPSLAD